MSWFDQEVMPRLDAELVYSPHVRWATKHGTEWRARCPVHGGKNPQSFVVNTKTLEWTCFSCAGGGGPLQFLRGLDQGPDDLVVRGEVAKQLMDELASRVGVRREDHSPLREPRRRPRPAKAEPPKRAPRAQVIDLWRRAWPLEGDAAAALMAWGVDVSTFDREELRVLPPFARVFGWCRTLGRWWGESVYRLIVPLRAPDMTPRGFIARPFVPVTGLPKTGAPAGLSSTGLVMANHAAREAILRGDASEPCIVREGERDWLLDAQCGEPVLGVRSGSWSDALTRALPRGWHLELATDRGPAGDAYAKQIVDSFTRCGRDDLRWERTFRSEALDQDAIDEAEALARWTPRRAA